MRLFILQNSVVNTDNDADAVRLLSQGAAELNAADIHQIFGADALLAGPQNTTVDEAGHVTYTPPSGPTVQQQATVKRAERDARIEAIRWRIERHQSEARLGQAPTDDIAVLDAYVQALRDVPSQPGFPEQIEWPTEPANS